MVSLNTVLHARGRQAVCWSSRTTKCQCHESFYWQLAPLPLVILQIEEKHDFHFYYQCVRIGIYLYANSNEIHVNTGVQMIRVFKTLMT